MPKRLVLLPLLLIPLALASWAQDFAPPVRSTARVEVKLEDVPGLIILNIEHVPDHPSIAAGLVATPAGEASGDILGNRSESEEIALRALEDASPLPFGERAAAAADRIADHIAEAMEHDDDQRARCARLVEGAIRRAWARESCGVSCTALDVSDFVVTDLARLLEGGGE